MRAVLRALGYKTGVPPANKTQTVGWAFLLALQTGMRAGELIGLEWPRIAEKTATLPTTKNGSKRIVPLSRRARCTLSVLRALPKPLDVSAGVLDALFRKARIKAGITDATFHDSRHTAATLIGAHVGKPTGLSFPEFCSMFGWRDPKYALVYCNPSADAIADKLG